MDTTTNAVDKMEDEEVAVVADESNDQNTSSSTSSSSSVLSEQEKKKIERYKEAVEGERATCKLVSSVHQLLALLSSTPSTSTTTTTTTTSSTSTASSSTTNTTNSTNNATPTTTTNTTIQSPSATLAANIQQCKLDYQTNFTKLSSLMQSVAVSGSESNDSNTSSIDDAQLQQTRERLIDEAKRKNGQIKELMHRLRQLQSDLNLMHSSSPSEFVE